MLRLQVTLGRLAVDAALTYHRQGTIRRHSSSHNRSAPCLLWYSLLLLQMKYSRVLTREDEISLGTGSSTTVTLRLHRKWQAARLFSGAGQVCRPIYHRDVTKLTQGCHFSATGKICRGKDPFPSAPVRVEERAGGVCAVVCSYPVECGYTQVPHQVPTHTCTC